MGCIIKLKVRQSQKQIIVSSVIPKNKRNSLTMLSGEDAQDSDFRSFHGRIEVAINCFRDLLTFSLQYASAMTV